MKWLLRGCPACGGDLHQDIQERGWVTCFMCTRSFRIKDIEPRPQLVATAASAVASEPERDDLSSVA